MTTSDEPTSIYASVERMRTTDAVVAQLQDLIIGSKLKAGDALPAERELAQQLAVSRNVLREALGVLGSKGLVEVVPGRGTFVALPSPAHLTEALDLLLAIGHVQLLELADARLAIEPTLAAMAAEHITDDRAKELRVCMAALESADTAQAHVEADIRFHATIARMSGNHVLEAMVNAVRDSVIRSMLLGLKEPRAVDDSDDHHRRVCDAVVSGDVEGANQAMAEHLRYVREYVVRHLS
ncbi:FadR/GntR family transcriptional regulator [Jiangella asiatica]|uniref:FadR family transcriptional regulator n=1 Tax=Jiangella asiatica TaxID=2530372 RepID=A0A4R5DA54_9ACTN|nr:FadR/GntR family transcriptional regulator [Jiangella asiatica]TDE09697.1 FadR family transcriptional regulator [Jiangella asiatica]